MSQNTSHAVMAQCADRRDRRNYFPTPPWATRALCEALIGQGLQLDQDRCWEPACGGGWMARPLAEYFDDVLATDAYDYTADWPDQYAVHDFLMPWGLPDYWKARPPEWIITNPPFATAGQFARRALEIATTGVALLVRTQFLEGIERHGALWAVSPPWAVWQFAERVPMVEGRVDPKASTATGYCWVVWSRGRPGETALRWIAPCRKRLEVPEDYRWMD